MSTFLADLAESAALRSAVLFAALGVIGAVIAAGVGRTRRPVPGGGAIVAAAALLVLWARFPVPSQLLIGCVLMAGGALLGTSLGERFVGVLIGAYVVAFSAGGAVSPVITGAAIALAAALVTTHDDHFRDAASTMPLFFGSTLGVLVTVPDTEQAMVLVGAALPTVLLGWPLRLGSLGPAGAAAIGVFGYVAVTAVRAGAVIGALGSLGLLLVEPIGRALARRRPTALRAIAHGRGIGFYVFVALHAVLVLGAARIAGLRNDATTATLLLLPFLAAGVLLAAAPSGAQPPPVPDDSAPPSASPNPL